MEVEEVVLYLEEDDDDLLLDEPPPPPPPPLPPAAASLGVVTAFPAAAADDRALPSGEALPSVLGKGELARLGTASAFVGTDDTVPSPAASDMGAGLAARVRSSELAGLCAAFMPSVAGGVSSMLKKIPGATRARSSNTRGAGIRSIPTLG